MCSFCIFIGRELCVIKVHTHGWRQLMAWSNLAHLFRGSSHGFCQLYYNIKQIDFIFFVLLYCNRSQMTRHSVWRTKSHALDCVSCVPFCSSYDMTSSVIYYSTDARKNEIYFLNGNLKKHWKLSLIWSMNHRYLCDFFISTDLCHFVLSGVRYLQPHRNFCNHYNKQTIMKNEYLTFPFSWL